MEYIETKTILRATDDAWFGSSFTANLYRGCGHGCIYCDSRSDCYAIKHFDTVRAKRNALSILNDELAHKKKKGIVSLGAMSDSYNPYEKELEWTRGALKLLDRYGFGVTFETKSDLVTRDIDVLRSIATHSPVNVKLTITTPYDDLAKKLEPKACSPKRRFAALRALAEANIYCGVLLTPVLPFIEDDSAGILSILETAAEAGVRFVYAGSAFGVTLRDSQRTHFLTKAEKLFPGMREKYVKAFGDAYFCVSPNNDALYAAYTEKSDRLGLKHAMADIVADNKRPYETQQISLFDL